MSRKFAFILAPAALLLVAVPSSATNAACASEDECKNECIAQCLNWGGTFDHCVDVECAQVVCQR